jgi:hypothetical protein
MTIKVDYSVLEISSDAVGIRYNIKRQLQLFSKNPINPSKLNSGDS